MAVQSHGSATFAQRLLRPLLTCLRPTLAAIDCAMEIVGDRACFVFRPRLPSSLHNAQFMGDGYQARANT